MFTDDESPLEFPCEFPIKAMGRGDEDFALHVVGLIRPHAPDMDSSRVRTTPSRHGRYVSVTVTITAENRAQLDAIYRSLHADERVVMTL